MLQRLIGLKLLMVVGHCVLGISTISELFISLGREPIWIRCLLILHIKKCILDLLRGGYDG